MEAHDGTTDPFDHLENFRSLILLQVVFDSIMCKSFLTPFRKVARAWYARLPQGLIYSFKKFGHQFVAQFLNSKRLKRASDFFSIQQEEVESLHYYMDCFKVAMLEVHGLKPFVVMSTLKRGLQRGSFYFSLFKKFFKSLPELLAYAKKYINIEECMVKKQKEKGDWKCPREDHSHSPSSTIATTEEEET